MLFVMENCRIIHFNVFIKIGGLRNNKPFIVTIGATKNSQKFVIQSENLVAKMTY